jgi:hypothetical protein
VGKLIDLNPAGILELSAITAKLPHSFPAEVKHLYVMSPVTVIKSKNITISENYMLSSHKNLDISSENYWSPKS